MEFRAKTFELISSNDRPLNPLNIVIAFALLTAVYFLLDNTKKNNVILSQ
jgi:hypothetical protein